MDDLRAKAKTFYNALDFDRPINFGLDELVENALAQPEGLYVESLHGGGESGDPVVELAAQIDFSLSAGTYLFTGNQGTGKTTELMRLAKRLKGLGCEVFYVDLSDYLSLTQRIEITDFLIGVLGALSEKVSARFGVEVGQAGFFARAWSFLQSEVKFDEVSLPAGPMEFKAALRHTRTFTEELQDRTRSHVQELVQKARQFVLEVVELIRKRRGAPDMKVVLIVDSVERLRGSGTPEEIHAVFQSAVQLFSADSASLRFMGMSVVYTVPPYLQALAGRLGSLYAGGRVYALPSVHIYECCPGASERARSSDEGLAKMLEIVDRRFRGRSEFFSDAQLRRLAENSGGDLRDYFRMLRLAITGTLQAGIPATDDLLRRAEDAVRSDMPVIADDDRAWLRRIEHDHQPGLPSLAKLPDFARLQQGGYVLQYRNGEDWFAVHPLLRKGLGLT
jgi:hypothetical protein